MFDVCLFVYECCYLGDVSGNESDTMPEAQGVNKLTNGKDEVMYLCIVYL